MIKKTAIFITVLTMQGCTVVCPDCARVSHKFISTAFGCKAAAAYEFGSIVPIVYRDECSPPELSLDLPNLMTNSWDGIGVPVLTGYGLFERQTLDPYYRESVEDLYESLYKAER